MKQIPVVIIFVSIYQVKWSVETSAEINVRIIVGLGGISRALGWIHPNNEEFQPKKNLLRTLPSILTKIITIPANQALSWITWAYNIHTE